MTALCQFLILGGVSLVTTGLAEGKVWHLIGGIGFALYGAAVWISMALKTQKSVQCRTWNKRSEKS